jgi:excisionase family DNA binding protein
VEGSEITVRRKAWTEAIIPFGGKTMDPYSETMTADELAAYLKVSRATVYKMLKCKELPRSRVGRKFRFRRADIKAWIREREKALAKP